MWISSSETPRARTLSDNRRVLGRVGFCDDSGGDDVNQEKIDRHNELCESAKKAACEAGAHGEWNNEPNRLNWKHAGLDCMLVRHFSSLHWCGYVGLRPGHPAFGKGYDEVESGVYEYEKSEYTTPAIFPDLSVHGGLTFSDKCDDFVCHLTDDPKDETWWLGFDCAHSGDFSPGHAKYGDTFRPLGFESYKTMEIVKLWTERLADQLAREPGEIE